jgi:hypothetical protein
MGVTITAVPAPASPALPAPQPVTERALSDFVANLQNGPMSGMPNLANPAALASEVFSNLRGFVERMQKFQAPRVQQGSSAEMTHVVSASFGGEPLVNPQRSPAPDSPEPEEIGGGMSRGVRTGSDQIQQVADMIVESLNFATEAQLVTQGAMTIPRSFNTLLRGQ